jgi:hypothetical protein
VDAPNREAQAHFTAYLRSRRDELQISDVDVAAFICATAIEAVAHNAVLHHNEMASDRAVENLIDETTRLITGYLKRT